MIVFWEKNLVVLSVPKTGSTALEAAIGGRASVVVRDPPTLKHMTLAHYRRFFSQMEDALGQRPETMAVIREPVDWLGSWYRYRHRAAIADAPQSTRGVSFDDFVGDYLSETPSPRADLGRQSRFVADDEGHVAVDHLFRYEAQEAIRQFLTARLGFDYTLRRVNVSDRMPVALSPDIEAALRAARAEDFALWESARTTP